MPPAHVAFDHAIWPGPRVQWGAGQRGPLGWQGMIPRSLAAGQDVTITSGVTDRCSCPSWTMWCVHDWHTSPQDPRIPSPCVPFQASGCPSEVLGLVLPIKHPSCCLDHRGILMEPHGGRVPLQGEAHRQVPPTHCHISSSQRGPVSSHCPTPSRPAQPRPCGPGQTHHVCCCYPQHARSQLCSRSFTLASSCLSKERGPAGTGWLVS